MKRIFFALAMATMFGLNAQNINDNVDVVRQEQDSKEELKVMYINKDVSTHFIAMEDISYVDISNNKIVGDIPLNNVLRLKPIEEGANGVVTIATEGFVVQYMLVYTTDVDKVFSRHNIQYSELRSLINSSSTITKSDMYDYASKMFLSGEKYYDVSTKAKKLKMTLNNIYTIDKYFFIDISLFNKTNIQFDIDQVRFTIEDKKKTKAGNFQSIEINPVLALSKDKSFKRKYRNIFVFEKFTFPEDKVFTIEISEKQISGRTIILRVSYADVLNADTFIMK